MHLFFLMFRASEVLSVSSSKSFQISRRKVVILRQFFQVCSCFEGPDKRGDYGSDRDRCSGQIDDFPRVTGLPITQGRRLRPPCFMLICRASRRPISSVEFKFVARQSCSFSKTRSCCSYSCEGEQKLWPLYSACNFPRLLLLLFQSMRFFLRI